jgi:hypothetical protein
VVAARHGDIVAGEDDLAGVAVQEPVGEVSAEGIGEIQSAFGPPADQVPARGDPVEHQAAHHAVPGLLCLGDHLAQRGGVLLELVGVGEQVPARAGPVPQGVSELGVGVLVPRAGAGAGGDDAQFVAGGLEFVPLLVGDVLGEVEGDEQPLDAQSPVVAGPGGQQWGFDGADDGDQGGRGAQHRDSFVRSEAKVRVRKSACSAADRIPSRRDASGPGRSGG